MGVEIGVPTRVVYQRGNSKGAPQGVRQGESAKRSPNGFHQRVHLMSVAQRGFANGGPQDGTPKRGSAAGFPKRFHEGGPQMGVPQGGTK
jgi:hypothetical protein